MTAATASTLIGVTITAGIIGALEHRSRSNVVSAGFWFDENVVYAAAYPERIGGPLTEAEHRRVREVARAEVERAFAGFRVRITDRRNAFYRVRVAQVLTFEFRQAGRWSGAAGQSNVFGPLGGYGRVSFYVLSSQAITHAPPGATRAEIVDAIGRGIGRAAVHEFAHQILPHGPMHTSQDDASYEYWTSNRAAQYYGDMHWSVAYPKLQDRLAQH